MCTINIPYFFLELTHPKTSLQIIFNYINDKIVEYKFNKSSIKKFGQYLIK